VFDTLQRMVSRESVVGEADSEGRALVAFYVPDPLGRTGGSPRPGLVAKSQPRRCVCVNHYSSSQSQEESRRSHDERPRCDELRELNTENEDVIRALRRQRDTAETKLAKIENLVNTSREHVIAQDGTSAVPLRNCLRCSPRMSDWQLLIEFSPARVVRCR